MTKQNEGCEGTIWAVSGWLGCTRCWRRESRVRARPGNVLRRPSLPPYLGCAGAPGLAFRLDRAGVLRVVQELDVKAEPFLPTQCLRSLKGAAPGLQDLAFSYLPICISRGTRTWAHLSSQEPANITRAMLRENVGDVKKNCILCINSFN